MRIFGMLTGVTIRVTAKDRAKLEAILADRNSPQKHVWRARIILLTADGCGTAAIMRGSGTSKTAVWRWQERFMTEGATAPHATLHQRRERVLRGARDPFCTPTREPNSTLIDNNAWPQPRVTDVRDDVKT
jgi:hypothetical protein